jgi:hypothetical protein
MGSSTECDEIHSLSCEEGDIQEAWRGWIWQPDWGGIPRG